MYKQLRQVLKLILLAGVFLLPFIPFVVTSSMFFPFITGKAFFFRIIVEIVFAAWVGLLILDKSYRPRFSWISVILISFSGFVLFANLVAAPSFFKSFWSNFERMEGFVTILHLVMYFFAAASVLEQERVRTWLLRTTVFVSGIVGFYAVLQLLGFLTINQGGVRLDATFGNATYLAVYTLIHIFLAALLSYRERFSRIRYLYFGAVVLNALVLYYTATRGAILGLLGGALLAATILLIRGKGEHPRLWKVSVGLFCALFFVIGGFFAMKATDSIPEGSPLARLASISLTERTVESRFLIWQTAWEGAKERPFFGWGQEGFIYVFNKHYDPEMWKQEPWFDRAHNVFLDWLVSAGFPGLILYTLLFLSALLYVWKGDLFTLPERAILTGLFAAYFFHNLFVFDNIVSYWLFITVIALLHARYVSSLSTGAEDISTQGATQITPRQYALLGATGIFLLATVYALNVPSVLSARTLLQALLPQEGGLEENLEFYKQAYAYNTVGQQEAAEQLSNAAQRVASFNNVPQEIKTQFVGAAVETLQSEIEKNPENPRPPFFLGGFFVRIGQPQNALPVLEHALSLGPNRQIVLFEVVRAYRALGDLENALQIAEQAYLLAPEYDAAAVLYAVLLYEAGDSESAEALLENVSIEEQAQSGELLTILAESGAYEHLALLWEARVRQNPENADARLALAASYVELGERTKAVEQIQEVIFQNPEFREQGEYYIKEIISGRNP